MTSPTHIRQTILIVDDTPENLVILGELLQPYYRVKATSSGMQALRVAIAVPRPDLILLDIVMPDIDGYTVLRRLQDDLSTRDIPVIFITSVDTSEDVSYGLELGAVDYITRPIRPPVVLSRVRTHLDLKQTRDRLRQQNADLMRSNAELARAVRAKDEFLANMSHELRTPLNVILGLSEALQEGIYGPISERQQRSLTTIEQSGRHLLSLINDILDLAKIDAGKVELERELASVEMICHTSLQFIRQQALKKNIMLTLDLDSALTSLQSNEACVQVYADERRLKQILINLLSNAVKFTPEGGEVGLEVHLSADVQFVQFVVWDTGIGIAPNDQQRLFQPFIQVDSSLSKAYEGTGLGLALVRRLTELHGGTVTLETEVGKGSRFMVSLPHARPHDQADPANAQEFSSGADPYNVKIDGG